MNFVFWSYLTWIVSGLSVEMYLAMLGTGRFLTVTARHSETRTPRIPDDVTTKCTFSDEGRNGQKSTWAVLNRTLKYSISGFINGALEWTECVKGILIEKPACWAYEMIHSTVCTCRGSWFVFLVRGFDDLVCSLYEDACVYVSREGQTETWGHRMSVARFPSL